MSYNHILKPLLLESLFKTVNNNNPKTKLIERATCCIIVPAAVPPLGVLCIVSEAFHYFQLSVGGGFANGHVSVGTE